MLFRSIDVFAGRQEEPDLHAQAEGIDASDVGLFKEFDGGGERCILGVFACGEEGIGDQRGESAPLAAGYGIVIGDETSGGGFPVSVLLFGVEIRFGALQRGFDFGVVDGGVRDSGWDPDYCDTQQEGETAHVADDIAG